mgnify:CR=1 FL=1
MLVCVEENVPAEITALTGLSAAELQQGTEPREALNSFFVVYLQKTHWWDIILPLIWSFCA